MPMMMNEFVGSSVVSSSTWSSGTTGFAFGFDANRVMVRNDKATPVYLTFRDTIGTTNGVRTCASETFDMTFAKVGGIGIASTTTSTGTTVLVWAWGN